MRNMQDFYTKDLKSDSIYLVRTNGTTYDSQIEEYCINNSEDVKILKESLLASGDLIELAESKSKPKILDKYRSLKPRLLFFMHYNNDTNLISLSDCVFLYNKTIEIDLLNNSILDEDFRNYIVFVIDHMFLYDYTHKNRRQIKVNNPSKEIDKNVK